MSLIFKKNLEVIPNNAINLAICTTVALYDQFENKSYAECCKNEPKANVSQLYRGSVLH